MGNRDQVFLRKKQTYLIPLSGKFCTYTLLEDFSSMDIVDNQILDFVFFPRVEDIQLATHAVLPGLIGVSWRNIERNAAKSSIFSAM